MKKIIILFALFASTVFSQNSQQKFQMQLKDEISQNNPGRSNMQLLNFAKIEKKNSGVAMLLSFVLPGMGELYAGSFESGKYLLITDAVLWGTVIGLNSYGNWKKDNYKSFAETYGGVSLSGKDENYFAHLGEYLSVDDYNREMDLQREYSSVYNTDKYYWNWVSESRRKEYKEMWRSSEQAFNSIRFAVGALILNRVISVINAIRLVTAHNKEAERQNSLDISFAPNYLENKAVGMSLNIRQAF